MRESCRPVVLGLRYEQLASLSYWFASLCHFIGKHMSENSPMWLTVPSYLIALIAMAQAALRKYPCGKCSMQFDFDPDFSR